MFVQTIILQILQPVNVRQVAPTILQLRYIKILITKRVYLIVLKVYF